MECRLTWLVGISTIFQWSLTVPLHSPHSCQMEIVKESKLSVCALCRQIWYLHHTWYCWESIMSTALLINFHHCENRGTDCWKISPGSSELTKGGISVGPWEIHGFWYRSLLGLPWIWHPANTHYEFEYMADSRFWLMIIRHRIR